jgi:putative inorganic carbon (hco3(-)) transporter
VIELLLYSVLFGNALISLKSPWVGVVVGYVFAIFGPHLIWYWAFENVRPFYYAVIPTLLGFTFAFVGGKIDLRPLKEPINICMLLLWASILISYEFGPYVHPISEYRWFDPDVILGNLNKIFLFYFISVLLLDDERKLKWGIIPIFIATSYLVYWANDMYVTGQWFGRLAGPSGLGTGSLYADENTFAMLFVTGLPFIYYLGWYVRSRVLRLILWLFIPFGFHAIFLTGSRGGLLGMGVIVLVAAFLSPRKIVGLLLIFVATGAFWLQGGPVIKERAATIADYQEESSAQTRIEAWEAGLGMIAAHPLTGVGVSSFGVAFPDFSDKRPRAAHNTIIQITAEWGVLGGGAFILALGLALRSLWRTRRVAEQLMQLGADSALYLLNEAVFTSLLGFFVCSLFLSLETYEVYYYLLMLAGALGRVTRNAALAVHSEMDEPPLEDVQTSMRSPATVHETIRI